MGYFLARPKDLAGLRSMLTERQGGKCAITGATLKKPVVDHSHPRDNGEAGLVRGVLENGPNMLLGKIERNCAMCGVPHGTLPDFLRAAADYIERSGLAGEGYNIVHPREVIYPKLSRKSVKILAECLGKEITYPKSGRMTIALSRLYKQAQLKPEYIGMRDIDRRRVYFMEDE